MLRVEGGRWRCAVCGAAQARWGISPSCVWCYWRMPKPGALEPEGRTEEGVEPEDAVAEVLGDVVLVRWEELSHGTGLPHAPGFYPARVVGVGGEVPDACGFSRGDRVLAARRREALEWVPTATRALGAVPSQDVVAVLR